MLTLAAKVPFIKVRPPTLASILFYFMEVWNYILFDIFSLYAWIQLLFD
jgi:hypothetical protein